MTVRARLVEWMSDEGLSSRAAAMRLKCSKSMVNKLLATDGADSRGPGLALAVRIQHETKGWAKGPINADEWVSDEPSLKPTGTGD